MADIGNLKFLARDGVPVQVGSVAPYSNINNEMGEYKNVLY